MGGEGVAGFDAKRDAVESVIFPIHPEHYSVMPGTGGVETMGGILCRNMLFRVEPDEVPGWIADFRDDS